MAKIFDEVGRHDTAEVQWNLDYPTLDHRNAASCDIRLIEYTVCVVNIIIIRHEHNLIKKLWLL